jgi:hypothetical protein
LNQIQRPIPEAQLKKRWKAAPVAADNRKMCKRSLEANLINSGSSVDYDSTQKRQVACKCEVYLKCFRHTRGL